MVTVGASGLAPPAPDDALPEPEAVPAVLVVAAEPVEPFVAAVAELVLPPAPDDAPDEPNKSELESEQPASATESAKQIEPRRLQRDAMIAS
jgi:hypothetical protein